MNNKDINLMNKLYKNIKKGEFGKVIISFVNDKAIISICKNGRIIFISIKNNKYVFILKDIDKYKDLNLTLNTLKYKHEYIDQALNIYLNITTSNEELIKFTSNLLNI